MSASTVALLVSFLTFVVTPTGAGFVASWLFDQARDRIPFDPSATGWRMVVRNWLYTPQLARRTSSALAYVVALLATALTAILTGASATGALDTALASVLAAAMGVVSSSLMHGELHLPRELRAEQLFTYNDSSWFDGVSEDEDGPNMTNPHYRAPSPFDGETDPLYQPKGEDGLTDAERQARAAIDATRATPDENGAVV